MGQSAQPADAALTVELCPKQDNERIKRGLNYPTIATYGSSPFQGVEEGGYGGMGTSFSDKAIRLNFIRLVFAIIGAIIFSLYIVFDTQMMMGGNHKYSLDPEEYVFAALNLYLDIINLFLYILQIIGASRD